MDLGVFEKKIGVTFQNKELLKQAFIHRSYLNENRSLKMAHNERLEFLGDAVLELIVTEYLYHKYPDNQEGDLTSYRASLVNAVTLSGVAESLGFNDYLLLSKGEARDTGRARQSILADTMESVIGAIYIDQGYEVAKQFISENIFGLIDSIVAQGAWIDAKSRFQELAQEKTGVTPAYKTIRESGPDHDKHFLIGVYLNEACLAEGEGKSKQEAEQKAAEGALKTSGW
ncbi:MAG: ribonuclease III [Candidatus Pacebacteria bacterium]|nr:ribonuclease III [Candidatus Paceibacterota bacterium]MDD5356630.1 ribonuclease III [Candidatus Paceibacterota bacterium]